MFLLTVLELRAGRTQSLDRIQGFTLWRGRLTISEFGIESVEYHAGGQARGTVRGDERVGHK